MKWLGEIKAKFSRPSVKPLIATAEEEQWWQEQRAVLRRRWLRHSLLKAAGVVILMAAFQIPWGSEFLPSGIGALLLIPAGLLLGGLVTAFFMSQNDEELGAERRKRILGRRMQQAILDEQDEIAVPIPAEDSRQ